VHTRTGLARVDEREDRLVALIGRMAAGDESALVDLYDGTAPQVFGLALRILGDRSTAEEVTGDAYLQAWRQATRFDRRRGTPFAWLLTIVRTRAIDRRRSAGGRAAAELPQPEIAAPETPDVALEVESRRRLVRAALASLRPEQREAVELAYFGGLSHGQIAARLDVPLGTVKTRLRLGMSHLRATLAAGEGDAE
jgi:RNA polymerase sigma-70 factor, ECF subfamily